MQSSHKREVVLEAKRGLWEMPILTVLKIPSQQHKEQVVSSEVYYTEKKRN